MFQFEIRHQFTLEVIVRR